MKKVLLIVAALCAMSIGACAQCATFPCVVATTSLTHQRHAIAPTTIFIPAVEGTFRFNMYMSATGDGTGQSQWQVYLRWADRIGMHHIALAAFSHYETSAPFGTFVVHSVAGHPLEFRTVAVPERSQAAREYDLYIVVEQLQ
jgi:hypothetical protein